MTHRVGILVATAALALSACVSVGVQPGSVIVIESQAAGDFTVSVSTDDPVGTAWVALKAGSAGRAFGGAVKGITVTVYDESCHSLGVLGVASGQTIHVLVLDDGVPALYPQGAAAPDPALPAATPCH